MTLELSSLHFVLLVPLQLGVLSLFCVCSCSYKLDTLCYVYLYSYNLASSLLFLLVTLQLS